MRKNKKKKLIRGPDKSTRRSVAPPKQGRGRPSMMTDQVRERLCEALREGNHLDVSCSYAGIGYSTFRGWLVAAQKSDADRELLDFLEAVTRAMHDFERFAVKSIKDQMPSDWRAAIAMLERRLPQKWGRRERVEVTGRGGGPISLVAEAKRALAVPEIRQALNQIAKYAPLRLPGDEEKGTVDEAIAIPEVRQALDQIAKYAPPALPEPEGNGGQFPGSTP